MKYLERIYHQELYLGADIKNNYFEGWYFKHVDKNKNFSISCIVGISKSTDDHSFIQLIDNLKNKSYYFKFDIKDFVYHNYPFYIKIKDNFFSLERIFFDIKNPKIIINVSYHELLSINKNFYQSNIMGLFAYFNFLECYHAVISLRHILTGYVEIYDEEISLSDGLGYIEKDYGSSFPNKYIWIEGNNNNSSVFLSIARDNC